MHTGTVITETQKLVERAMKKHLIPVGAQCDGEFVSDSSENGNHYQWKTRCNGKVVTMACEGCGDKHCAECLAQCIEENEE